MIIHGLTTSTDMFIMPEHYNLVSYLLDNGYTDVWCLDMRMSNRHSYNLFPHRYSFDDIALYDYPPAIGSSASTSGTRPLHVIAHCLGSVTFMMSLFGKAVDRRHEPDRQQRRRSRRACRSGRRMKLRNAPGIVEHVLGFPNLNPRWADDPTLTRGKLFSKGVSFFHRECDVPACHMLSLMWGTGWPALYSHENLADVTHRRGGDLYGATSMHYYRHVNKMLARGQPAGEVRDGQARARVAAGRLLRLRARDRDAGAAHHRRRQQGVHGLEHRLPRAAAGARVRPPRAEDLPGLRASGRVHGRARRARLLPRHARLHPPPRRAGGGSRRRSSGQPSDQDGDAHQGPRRARVGGDDRLRVVPGLEPVRPRGARGGWSPASSSRSGCSWTTG